MRNIKAIINRYRWFCNAFQAFGSRPPFPLLILVHLTTACQCRCRMCYQRQDEPVFADLREPMEPSLFESLLLGAKRFPRRPLIHLYGGEPLLHPGFRDFVGLLSRHGFRATINTNGELLESHAGVLARGPVGTVLVSLDGLGQAHDELRERPGLFERAIAGMKALRGQDGRMLLTVNYVLNETNARTLFDDLVGFERLFAGTRLDYFSIEHLAFTRDMFPLARAVDTSALRENLLRMQRRKFPFPVSATPIVRVEDLDAYYHSMEPLGRVNCNVPWIGLNVFSNGDVTPGGAMFECTRTVGNLSEQELKKIWAGERMVAFRRRIRNSMPENCLRCCHTLHYSPLFRCTLAPQHGSPVTAGAIR